MTILSIIYLEPEWQQTKACIEATGLPAVYVHRKPKGIGSLAEAINRGVKQIEDEYTWIVTNVTFEPDAPVHLLADVGDYAILHPAFASDHEFCRPDGSGVVKRVPFVEFTCPLVKTSVLKQYPLNENMPYWGHDPDFGYRMWKSGHRVGVHHGVEIGHTYIRHNNVYNQVTTLRKRARKSADYQTHYELKRIYGITWRERILPRTIEKAEKYFNDNCLRDRNG